MKRILVILSLIVSSSMSFAETAVDSAQGNHHERRIKYDCDSTTDSFKRLRISVGTDIEIAGWYDRELVGTLIVDIGFKSVESGWRVSNGKNCGNNLCVNFNFDPGKKILDVHLYENDDMGTYYEQIYQCEEL